MRHDITYCLGVSIAVPITWRFLLHISQKPPKHPPDGGRRRGDIHGVALDPAVYRSSDFHRTLTVEELEALREGFGNVGRFIQQQRQLHHQRQLQQQQQQQQQQQHGSFEGNSSVLSSVASGPMSGRG